LDYDTILVDTLKFLEDRYDEFKIYLNIDISSIKPILANEIIELKQLKEEKKLLLGNISDYESIIEKKEKIINDLQKTIDNMYNKIEESKKNRKKIS